MFIFTTIAAQGNVSNMIMNINWTKPSWDVFIILFFLIGSLLYGLSLGRDRVIGILVSIYMALAVVNSAPFIKEFAANPSEFGVSNLFVFRLSSFVGTFVILFLLLSRSALLRTVASQRREGHWWEVVIFSVLHVGLLISIIMSFVPASGLQQLSPTTRMVFTNEMSRFLWIVGPIIAMILFGKKPSRQRKSKDEDDE